MVELYNVQIGAAPPVCPVCGEQMKRDYKAEGAISNFHVTRDLFAEKKKRDARKSPHAGDYYRSRQ